MEEAIVLAHDISADDFTRMGEVSSDVKRKPRQMGVSLDATRKVAVAIYEGEANMVAHAKGGVITVEVTTEKIKVILADVGPGIPSVKLATQVGHSTALDEIRSLGFGIGMGLLGMKKYLDSIDIDTKIGEGTIITMVVSP